MSLAQDNGTPTDVHSQIKQIVEVLQHDADRSDGRILRIMKEFIDGHEFLKKYNKAATFFGSHLFTPESRTYKEAYLLGRGMAKIGYAVITGGGPGVMEAVNKGAYDVGGASVGINIILPQPNNGELRNPYVTDWITFKYFFVRKFLLMSMSELYFFFAGGYGTLDEFYEAATLEQTKKMDPVPIILVDDESGFWRSNCKLIDEVLYKKYHAIRRHDRHIYHRVDGAHEALAYVQQIMQTQND